MSASLSLSLLLAVLLPHEALALSCGYGPESPLPDDGTTAVPLNVRPRVALYDSTGDDFGLHLLDASGAEVPATTTRIDNPGSEDILYLLPDALLLPDADYTLHTDLNGDLSQGWVLSSFTTGSTEDTDTPAAPTLQSALRDRGEDEWGAWDWLELSLRTPPAPATFRIEIGADADLTQSRAVEVPGWRDGSGIFTLAGSGPCGGSIVLDDDEQFVRVALVAESGAVSPFSAVMEATDVGGCSSLPRSPQPGRLAPLLLALVLVPGRRVRK